MLNVRIGLHMFRGHVITIDLETKAIHSNLTLNSKINRILYNYQKQINNIFNFDIIQ